MAEAFKVEFDFSKVNAFLIKALNSGRQALDNAIYKSVVESKSFITPKTPKDKGTLRRSYLAQRRGFMDHWYYSPYGDSGASSHPYGIYQERGYTSGPVSNYTTPGTGAHFIESSLVQVNERLRINTETVLKQYYAV